MLRQHLNDLENGGEPVVFKLPQDEQEIQGSPGNQEQAGNEELLTTLRQQMETYNNIGSQEEEQQADPDMQYNQELLQKLKDLINHEDRDTLIQNIPEEDAQQLVLIAKQIEQESFNPEELGEEQLNLFMFLQHIAQMHSQKEKEPPVEQEQFETP